VVVSLIVEERAFAEGVTRVAEAAEAAAEAK